MNILNILFLFLIFSANIYANETKAVSKEWLSLLHYKDGVFGLKGDVDDEGFYQAKNGKLSPALEYIDNLERVKNKDQSFLCRFPARFKVLKKENNLEIDNSVLNNCKEYQDFLRVNSFQKAYLVFSSYYVESPASAFGHTFLRFSKNDQILSDKNSELLDVGINYGASNTSTNPLIYTLFGIFGGFRGEYASIPYHYKIREYNDFESRDLWSYELKLNGNQKEKLLDHLWELGNTWYYYYFFNGNCSEKIMSLFDGIEPDWKLLDKLPFYIVPAETIKTLHTVPNLVGNITFRPSKRRVFLKAYTQLSSNEKNIFDQINHDQNFNSLALLKTEEEKTKTLDALIEYTDFKWASKVLREDPKMTEWKNLILTNRSKLSGVGADLSVDLPKDEIPHLSHPTHKTQLAIVKREGDENPLYRLSHRFALHDFTDSTIGSPRLSSINFFKFSVNLKKDSLYLDSFTPVEMASLNPWGNYSYPPSIVASLSYKRNQMDLCHNCKEVNLEIGIGPSWSFNNDHFIPYLLLNTNYIYASSFKENFELNAGLRIGSIFRLKDAFAMQTDLIKSYGIFNNKMNYSFNYQFQYYHSKAINSSLFVNSNSSYNDYGIGINYLY